MSNSGAEKKVLAGVLGILVGSLGVHRFVLGDVQGGLIRLVISVCTLGVGGIIGFIEGIIYLIKSDEEFVAEYINGDKKWF